MKTIKVIDLLVERAKGNIIKKFKYDSYVFEYNSNNELWINDNGDTLDFYCNIEVCLNDEVEIIEEPKKIEKIPYKFSLSYVDLSNREIVKKEMDETINGIYSKVNEIIDFLMEDNNAKN